MSTKPNYFKIGVFVFVAVVITLVAIVFFGAGVFTQDKIYLETYFDESVSGLSVGSPVELRGVRLGIVEQIGFVTEAYDIPEELQATLESARYVRVLFSVSSSQFPGGPPNDETIRLWNERIHHGLRLRLASNILTGQAYLEGTYLDPNRYPVPMLEWRPRYTYVPSAPSQISTMKDSLDRILQRLEELDIKRLLDTVEKVFVSLDKAIEEAKIDEISSSTRRALDSVDRAVADANVPAISGQVQSLLVEARQTNQHLKDLLAGKESDSPPANLPDAIAKLNRVLVRIDNLISRQTPQIEETLEDLRKVSSNLKEITDTLKKDPSIILSQPPPKSEVVQ